MKDVFQQILTIALSFLILFSTLSLRVDMHFCGGHLVDFSIGRKAATCGMETASSVASGVCIMTPMQCCTDFEIVIQAQEELQLQSSDYSFSKIQLPELSPPQIPQTTYHAPPPTNPLQFKEYIPPPLVRKMHLLHESFLI